MYQQNKVFTCDDGVWAHYPWLEADEGDRLLRCAKAFGADAACMRDWARAAGVPCSFDEGVPSAAIPLGSVAALREMCPGVALAESANVFERRETGELYLREVGVREM